MNKKHWAIEPEEREDISEEPILPTNMEVETSEIRNAKRTCRRNQKLKKNKAPGPDYIPAELFKCLDGQPRNKC